MAADDLSQAAELDALAQWFEQRGFRLSVDPEGGDFSANLVRIPSGGSVHRYSQGDTPLDAARGAQQRWKWEQE